MYSVLCYQDHLFIPNVDELRKKLLLESYSSWYSIHLGATNVYRDLWEVEWWNGIKKDIAKFMAKC